jgi:hypothetical protein
VSVIFTLKEALTFLLKIKEVVIQKVQAGLNYLKISIKKNKLIQIMKKLSNNINNSNKFNKLR